MNKLMTIPKFCCVCNRSNSKNAKFRPLTKKSGDLTISDKLDYCIPEITNLKSPLIKSICKNCHINLNTMYELKQQCIQTHKNLNDRYKKINESTINKEIEKDQMKNGDDESTLIKSEPLQIEVQPDIEEMVTVYRVEVIKELEEHDNENNDNENNLTQYLDEFAENLANQRSSDRVENFVNEENNGESDDEKNVFFGFTNHDIKLSSFALKQTSDTMKNLTAKDKKLNVVCKFCSMKFKNGEVCKEHELEHEDKKPNICLVCMKFLGPHISLKTHLHEHRRSINFKYMCDFCNEKFATPNDLEYHCSIVHDQVSHVCIICEKKFTTKLALKIHVNTHLRTEEDLIPCKACNKKFIRLMSYERHYRLVHQKIKPFSCHLCSKTFGLKQYLQRHLDVHTGLKRFQCTLCQKLFRYQDSLTYHLKIHKKHKCPLCDEHFMTFKQMRQHERQHRTDLPYHCNFCPLNFKLASHLGNHISKKHINEFKPFLN